MIMINIDYNYKKKKKKKRKKKKIMGWEKEGGFFDDEEINGPIIFGSGGRGGGRGSDIWPSRSYSCGFCSREFRSAQALGGHMNVHRRDRARLMIIKHQDHDHDIQQTELTASTTHHHHHHQQQQLINVITSGGGGGNCQDDEDDDDINGCRKRVKLSRHIDHNVILPLPLPLPPTVVFPFFVHEPAAACSNSNSKSKSKSKSRSSLSSSSCDQSRPVMAAHCAQAHHHLDLELRLATP